MSLKLIKIISVVNISFSRYLDEREDYSFYVQSRSVLITVSKSIFH